MLKPHRLLLRHYLYKQFNNLAMTCKQKLETSHFILYWKLNAFYHLPEIGQKNKIIYQIQNKINQSWMNKGHDELINVTKPYSGSQATELESCNHQEVESSKAASPPAKDNAALCRSSSHG